jgi:gliding motility-associated-like protein
VGDTAPSLPNQDINGIYGTWEPAAINTSIANITEYVFTPDRELYPCYQTDTVVVHVRPIVQPALPPIDPICQYSDPPALPDTIEGVTGSWLPDTISTDHPGTFTFVFVPDPEFDCAFIDSIEVIIDSLIVPQFDPIGPVCQFDTPPLLPEANFNGVTGTWTPSVTQTDSAGIFPFVFEPEPGYHCAQTDTLWLEVRPWVKPEFEDIGPLCEGTIPPELPLTDISGIPGTWDKDSIDTSTEGLYLFTFTPDDSVICVEPRTIPIRIIKNLPPTARNDSAFTIQGIPVDINLLANDYDNNPDNMGAIDTSSLNIYIPPNHGTVEFSDSAGVVTYIPEADYFGLDTFYYSICDNGYPCDPLCDTARVIVEIGEPNIPPVAVNDSFTVMCYPLTGYLLDNDYDPDKDDIQAMTIPIVEPSNGTVTIYSDGSFVYMPDEGFIGIDTFIYEICDNGIPSLCDQALVWIKVLPDTDCDGVPDYGDEPDDCSLLIPDGFSPNGDGVHDFFQIFCMEKYPDAVMHIFDRAGNKLFEKQHYGNLKYWGSHEEAWWWGTSENKWIIGRDNLPAGNYLYVLELGNGEVRTGTVMVAY